MLFRRTMFNTKWIIPLSLALVVILLLAVIVSLLWERNASDNGYTDGHTPETRSFQVGDHPALVLKGHGSNVNIHTGEVGIIHVTMRKHGSKSALDRDDVVPTFDQRQIDGGIDRLTITTDPIYKDVDYDIVMPPAATAHIEVDSGSIAVTGISGVTIDSNNGSLVLDTIKGPVDAHTESGDITVRDLQGQTKLEIGSGLIYATNVNGPLNAITRSGDVIVRGSKLNGQSALKTSSGSVRFEGALAMSGTYTMSTNSGDVDLTLPQSSAFQLKVITGSGAIHNEFHNDLVGNPPYAQILVNIGSGSCDIMKAA